MAEIETLVFAALFLAQTLIYVILLRRVMTSRGITAETREALEKLRRIEETLGRLQRPASMPVPPPPPPPPPPEEPALPDSAIEALKLLRDSGPMTSTDVSRALGRSREHVSRVMKALYTRGLVSRSGKPFRYELTPRGAEVLDITGHHGRQSRVK
ncbi:MAG: winged helix DNA-binding protein [Aigarchaeota archaeon]|nr:winged helix DNA-binding protein [Candidatus Pelearchaeum maunauluense]